MDAQLKVSRAITNLAFTNPFFGSCLMQLHVQENIAIPTMATNGQDLFWGRDFVDELTEPHTRGVLAHEVMHVILGHCVPHEGKDHQLCNVAMDWVINEQLRLAGFELPEGALFDPTGKTSGWAWQEVYNYLKNIQEDKQDANEGTPDRGSDDQPSDETRQKIKDMIGNAEDHFDQNEGETGAEAQERRDRIDDMVVKAANAAEAAGKDVPGDVKDRLKQIREPKVDWREALINRARAPYPEDFTMAKPNRKFLQSGLYLPSMVGEKPRAVGIGLDTSGSMSREDLENACSEVNYIINDIKPEVVYLMSADHAVANVREYTGDVWFDVSDFEVVGGGGTSFAPVFDHIRENNIEIDQMIYFSDMYVSEYCFPREHPDYPVTFVSTGGYEPDCLPFGELIKVR